MPWKMENGPDGLPIWSGVDSIYDVKQPDDERKADEMRRWLLLPIVILGLVAGISSFMAGLVIMIGGAAWALWARNPEPRFLGHKWAATATRDGLRYVATNPNNGLCPWPDLQWQAPLSDIASVEAGKTAEWQPTRDYRMRGGRSSDNFGAVPAVEYQAFLVMNDGTRRVLYSANAEREQTAALAHSVRTWLDRARSGAPSIVAYPARPLPPASAEGFDL